MLQCEGVPYTLGTGLLVYELLDAVERLVLMLTLCLSTDILSEAFDIYLTLMFASASIPLNILTSALALEYCF